MFIEGASELSNKADLVDSLNVFPVPDGDTGTNMNLTITSGVKEVRKAALTETGVVANAFAKGLLMGARGNSGVILSQLFRGFAKSAEGKKELTIEQFAQALDAGVTTAYKAVMKPVEGTILTVAKDTAKFAVKQAKKEDDFPSFLKAIIKEAERSLSRTPDLLAVLKEVGVVDSGGQGLVFIYAGFLQALTGEKTNTIVQEPKMEELVNVEHHQHGQMDPNDIEFGYCTEVMVQFDAEMTKKNPYDEEAFRQKLSNYGDSLLVVSDEDLLKVHIHAEHPGHVLTAAQAFGPLIQVKIENMREQNSNLSETHATKQSQSTKPKEKAPFAIVAVSMGSGIEKLFKGLGVNAVVAGGQTMNPSTEDIVQAIEKVHAENVIVLPNNSNIVMAAEQAADVCDVHAVVVPTKTVPQGLAAMLAFNASKEIDENAETMTKAIKDVKTGELTYAVRDTQMDNQTIKNGDFMGIFEKKIVSSGRDLIDVAKQLLTDMVDEESEVVTIITGEDATSEDIQTIEHFLNDTFAELEIDVVEGKQPLYSYIFSVE
ncbi:DAK2 domain-containing protein [Shouchella xiaoxiensis]|nr:DAK2 domain-containing protein [Shouchella xiaoxiensis]